MKKTITILVFIFSFGVLNACNSETIDHEGHPILYTTIYPIQFITEELVGDEADVISVYPPGVDAHSYEPTIREMLDIARGKAFIYLGAGMESFAESAKSALQASDVAFIEVGKDKNLFMPADHHDLTDHSHDHGDVDPHIWFDPLRMVQASEMIKDELTQIFPELSDHLNENFTTLTDQLIELDEQFKATLQSKQKHHIIVSHAAYQYWEERYGIIQVPISGLTAGDEPSQKELARIVNFAKRENITHILFEQNASNKIAEIIQDHIDAKALYIHNLEVLVDQDIEKEENYFSIMRTNLSKLDEATD